MPPLPLAISLALLGAASLAAGVPSLLARLPRDPRTPLGVTALLAAGFLLCSASAGAFDPYALAISLAGAWAALGALAALGPKEEGDPPAPFGPVDVAVWLLLWIPFDMSFGSAGPRWNYALFPGGEPWAYEWWSLAISVIAVVGWGRLRALPGFDARLVPNARDVTAALLATAGIFAIVLPAGLTLGFIAWPGVAREPLRVLLEGPTIFLTIAIPEELFFRGVLQSGLDGALAARRHGRLLSLGIASLLFGLMHWNNVATLEEQVAYLALATVSGAFYGMAYRRGGSILAAALVHTLVDWIWFALLTKP